MTTKFGRVVTYHEGLPHIKSHDPLITWSAEIMWQTKIIMSPIPKCPWPQNLAGQWLTLSRSCLKSHMVLDSRGLVRSRNKIKHISTITMPTVTKFSSVISYHEELLFIESHDSLIMWSSKNKWPIKIIIFRLLLCLWPQNLVRWWLNLKICQSLP